MSEQDRSSSRSRRKRVVRRRPSQSREQSAQSRRYEPQPPAPSPVDNPAVQPSGEQESSNLSSTTDPHERARRASQRMSEPRQVVVGRGTDTNTHITDMGYISEGLGRSQAFDESQPSDVERQEQVGNLLNKVTDDAGRGVVTPKPLTKVVEGRGKIFYASKEQLVDLKYLRFFWGDPSFDRSNFNFIGRGGYRTVVKGDLVISAPFQYEEEEIPNDKLAEIVPYLNQQINGGKKGNVRAKGSRRGNFLREGQDKRRELEELIRSSGKYEEESVQRTDLENGKPYRVIKGAIGITNKAIEYGRGSWRERRVKTLGLVDRLSLHPNLGIPIIYEEICFPTPHSPDPKVYIVTFSEFVPHSQEDVSVRHLLGQLNQGVNDKSKRIKREDLRYSTDLDWKTSVFKDAVNGIGILHEEAIEHRDFKPDNFRARIQGLDYVGVLLDFGNIKKKRDIDDAQSEMQDLTHTGADKGVPASILYCAPEHINRTGGHEEDDETWGSRDVFSIAATLYTCVTGDLPFNDPALRRIIEGKGEGYSFIPVSTQLKRRDPEIFPKFPLAQLGLSMDPDEFDLYEEAQAQKAQKVYRLTKLMCVGLNKDPHLRMNNVKYWVEDLDSILEGEEPQHTNDYIANVNFSIPNEVNPEEPIDLTEYDVDEKTYYLMQQSFSEVPEYIAYSSRSNQESLAGYIFAGIAALGLAFYGGVVDDNKFSRGLAQKVEFIQKLQDKVRGQ